MHCVKPVYLKDLDLSVPCGNCITCRVSYSREWSMRLIHEAEYYNKKCWITLTYDEDHLTSVSLSKDDVRNYFRRLRYRLSGRRIKYFLSGEYGEKNGRPHYHAILFDVSSDDYFQIYPGSKYFVDTCWKNGFVYIGIVTRDSVRYTTDYILKKLKGYGNKVYKSLGIEQPFRMSSNGIGMRWCLDHSQELIEKLYIERRGVKMRLPRYYVDLLNIDPLYYESKMRELKIEREGSYVDRGFNIEIEDNIYVGDLGTALRRSRTQNERNAVSRAKLNKERRDSKL